MLQPYADSARARRSHSVANGKRGERHPPRRSGPPRSPHRTAKPGEVLRLLLALLLSSFAFAACSEETNEKSSSPWTQFVHVAGQPDPVPVQWVSTPEGKFAHSIKIPNPVPEDSGYREGMTSKQYFEHLCKTEAGEFIFKTVDGVKGFYFMRPPKRPTDLDLMDRYKLEAPEIERTFQLFRPTPQERAKSFINPPWSRFQFVEEPSSDTTAGLGFLRIGGYVQDKSPMRIEHVSSLASRYGLVWRGIRRKHDRALAIAGSEWIVFDIRTKEVLAVQRNFARTGFNQNNSNGIWWLNAFGCPQMHPERIFRNRIYRFVTESLKPKAPSDE